MEVHFAPELQAKIDQFVIETGLSPDKLLEDALAGYVPELADTREMVSNRYDDLRSGSVRPALRKVDVLEVASSGSVDNG